MTNAQSHGSGSGCLSCDTVSGYFHPPGGIVYEDAYWLVALRARPIRMPCLPFIILKRHCEDVAHLHAVEAESLGPLMRLTAQVLDRVLQPAKVHFGLYSESVQHIHLHVFPRMPTMPAGNIPNRHINRWYAWLHKMGLRQPFADEAVATYAVRMREEYAALAGTSIGTSTDTSA